MEVRRSTVDLRSMSFSCDEAGKLLRYIDRSIRSELCSWSSSLTNFSFCIDADADTEQRGREQEEEEEEQIINTFESQKSIHLSHYLTSLKRQVFESFNYAAAAAAFLDGNGRSKKKKMADCAE